VGPRGEAQERKFLAQFAIREYSMKHGVRPQDILVVLSSRFRARSPGLQRTCPRPGHEPIRGDAAARRATHAGLLDRTAAVSIARPCLNFSSTAALRVRPGAWRAPRVLCHCVRCTAAGRRIAQGNDPPPVWPTRWPGTRRTFQALYRSAPRAAQRDLKLYDACPGRCHPRRPRARAQAGRRVPPFPPWAPHEACDPPSRDGEMATPR